MPKCKMLPASQTVSPPRCLEWTKKCTSLLCFQACSLNVKHYRKFEETYLRCYLAVCMYIVVIPSVVPRGASASPSVISSYSLLYRRGIALRGRYTHHQKMCGVTEPSIFQVRATARFESTKTAGQLTHVLSLLIAYWNTRLLFSVTGASGNFVCLRIDTTILKSEVKFEAGKDRRWFS